MLNQEQEAITFQLLWLTGIAMQIDAEKLIEGIERLEQLSCFDPEVWEQYKEYVNFVKELATATDEYQDKLQEILVSRNF